MENKVIDKINKIDEEISKQVKIMQGIPHNSILKVYCIETIKLLDVREFLVKECKEHSNGNEERDDSN